MKFKTILATLTVTAACGLALAEAPATQPATAPSTRPAVQRNSDNGNNLAVTRHALANGFAYTATAGTIKLRDEAGKPRADFFFTAYTKDDADAGTRPVTFVFNGGPGAASVWLHLGTVGPMRIDIGDEGEVPAPPYRVVPNEESWLPDSDLVFIDPIGTGYSRPAEGVKQEEFSGVNNDLASVGEFIRLYLTRNGRWGSPVFLAGESYGTTRAAGLSNYLADRYGISVNGVLLISTVLDFATLNTSNSNDLGYVLFVPTYATLAFHHGKLMTTTELPEGVTSTTQKVALEATKWANETYAPALAAGSKLNAEQRKKIAQTLSVYTGIDAAEIERLNLRVSPGLFRKRLLQDDRKIIGRFDGRITGFDPSPESSSAAGDPSYPGYQAVYTSGFNQYIRGVLGYESDAPYEVLSGRVQPWDFGLRGQGYYDAASDLRSALIEHPSMRVFVACGYTDLATPFAAAEYTFDRLDVPVETRKNVTFAYYNGGHMMYHVASDRVKLRDDVRAFINTSLRK